MTSKKVILTGSFGVGKTSLFNQFVFNQFSDKYLTTIGVKVNKKEIVVENQDLSLMIWDIAGEVTQNKVPNSYFLQASGSIYVYDLTRPMTLDKVNEDLDYLYNIVPNAVIKLIGNKKDLVTEEQAKQIIASSSVVTDFVTSAKTGENVENLFFQIGKEMLLK